jgi:hypothetical protein
MNIGVDCTLDRQCTLIHDIIKISTKVYQVISTLSKFKLNNAYIAAGCISHTIWNYQLGYEIDYGLSDIDIIYFDNTDLSKDSELFIENSINNFYKDIGIKIDVTNEARVHLWYHSKHGIHIPPYTSSESAINSWIPATAVGVNLENDRFNVYAPYGLNDMFGRVIRPNKSLATKEHFEEKAKKWKSKWNDVIIIPW